MTQLPEGVFTVFSAGPRQTALDRLSSNDPNPNSVFTRTFARELLQPGENLVQVAQHTRRIVSEMAETVSHKQIPVYFDQMVDDVFLNGVAKAEAAAKPAEPPPPPMLWAIMPTELLCVTMIEPVLITVTVPPLPPPPPPQPLTQLPPTLLFMEVPEPRVSEPETAKPPVPPPPPTLCA